MKSSQLDCDILFLRYEIEKRLRAVYCCVLLVLFIIQILFNTDKMGRAINEVVTGLITRAYQ